MVPIAGANPLLARANHYPGDAWERQDVADAYMERAINRGMLQERVLATEVIGSCPAQRCTWPSYTSLAVCSIVEDVSSLLIHNGSVPESGYDSGIFLQGIRPNFFDQGNTLRTATFAYRPGGGDPNFNAPRTSPERQTFPSNNSTISDLAQVFIWFPDSCLMKDDFGGQKNITYWRAFKASFKLCLQTYESSYGPTMESRLVSSMTDIAWRNVTLNGDYFPQLHHTPEGSQEDFWIYEFSLGRIGGQLATAFNMSSTLEVDFVIYTGGAQQFEADVIPRWNFTSQQCTVTGGGLDDFRRKIDNVAMSLTNA